MQLNATTTLNSDGGKDVVALGHTTSIVIFVVTAAAAQLCGVVFQVLFVLSIHVLHFSCRVSFPQQKTGQALRHCTARCI